MNKLKCCVIKFNAPDSRHLVNNESCIKAIMPLQNLKKNDTYMYVVVKSTYFA